MNIEKIDKNFLQNNRSAESEMTEYEIPQSPFKLYGIFYDDNEKRFMRIPKTVAENTSEGCAFLMRHTSGGRLKFSTDSDTISIKATYDYIFEMSHMPKTGRAGFSLIDETDGCELVYTFRPESANGNGFCASAAAIKKGVRNYILYFPLYNDVGSLTIGLKKGSFLGEGKPYENVKPVLYYGSSITQGGCASRPDSCYPALVSKWTNTDFINMGLSGNAKAEPAFSEYLSSIPCSVFVCDYDHNAPDKAHLEKTHLPLYLTFRAANPSVPVLFLTKPDPEREKEALQRKRIIRDTYLYAREHGDENVFFVDGYSLFGKADRENCTVDGTHPNDLGFYRMAKAVMKIIAPLLKS